MFVDSGEAVVSICAHTKRQHDQDKITMDKT
jgi:hypothetical protein